MFVLEHGREHLWQWDTNQRVMVEDNSITQVHFCNKTTPNSLVVETYTDDTYDGKVYAEIPNILLQESWDICVYAFCNCYTKVEERIKVKARSKPEDYVYTETEVLNYQTLLDKMNGIEENIGQEVENYLKENPIESGATQEEVAQINKNTEDIATLNTEVDKLPTKEYVDKAIEDVEVDLTGYATEQYVKDEIDKIEVNVDLEGYATENWVLNRGYISSVPSEYVTESELTAKGYATNSQLSAYAMKSDIPTVPTKVSQLENDKKYLTDSALGDYAKKTDIPQKVSYFENDKGYLTEHIDISGKSDVGHTHYYKDLIDKPTIPSIEGLATEQYVDDAIAGIEIPEGGGGTDGGRCVYYIRLANIPIGEANAITASEELVEFATRFSENKDVCLYFNDNDGTTSAGYKPALIVYLTSSITFKDANIDIVKIANNNDTNYYNYYLKNNGSEWVIYREFIGAFTLTTKEYVDSLFEGIATAEGGSY